MAVRLSLATDLNGRLADKAKSYRTVARLNPNYFGIGIHLGLPALTRRYVPLAITLCPKPQSASSPSCSTIILLVRNVSVILHFVVSPGIKVATLPLIVASPIASPIFG